jgi:hypothetical protein
MTSYIILRLFRKSIDINMYITLSELHMESTKTPPGLHQDSSRTPAGLPGVYQESNRTHGGV